MDEKQMMTIGILIVVCVVFLVIVNLLDNRSIDGIKAKIVGDGQHGTARWATKPEIKNTFVSVPFEPEKWRKGEDLPTVQGTVVGCRGQRKTVALVDTGDVHTLMIGAAGCGKTAFFLYPNIEFACASGMSFLQTDTKGDVARNYGNIAKNCYGYNVSVLDLRNPTRSDENNILHLVNKYMDLYLQDNTNLSAKAKAEKYAKITAKTIINIGGGDGNYGQNLVTDHHAPIVERDTFNRVQQELARRSSKRKISDKTKTEQGKYSGKYSLSELMICGHCGTPYRRKTWIKSGEKLAVWRCISRLEHGKKYCSDSPTIKEESLHKAIIHAINNYYSCRNDIARILKANIGTVLECQGQEEILATEKRLKEIDSARNDLVMLIASGGCDEDRLDSEFAKLYQEEQQLSERLEILKSQNKTSAETQAKLDKIMDMIEHEKFELETFDNVLIRKLIECIKVLDKTEILVIFKGGYEVKAEIE